MASRPPSRVGRRARRVLAVVLGLACCLGGARAQGDDFEGRGPDPYTRGDDEAVAAAGYVTLDMRAWAGDYGTRDIQELLGGVPLVWIETEHFRLGSTLPATAVHKVEKQRVRAELKRLKARLPRVKDRTKTLDPWLRAHLYAQRLEDVYARVQGLLGVTDADFVRPLPEGATRPARGQGPYLGMGDKFCVLLLERSSSLGRYGARWGTSPDPAPQVLYDAGADALGFATCQEWFTGELGHDTAFQCHVTWFVSQLLLRGYNGYAFEHSLWLRQGFGHVLSREIDPRFNTLPRIPDTVAETLDRWDWAPSVRARVGHGLAPGLAEMALWDPVGRRTFADHRMAWSRADWLLRQDPEAVARFFALATAPFDAGGQVPTREQVAAHERQALQSALGLDEAAADAAWAAWVESEYPRK